VDEAPAGPRWLHEIKYDGYRMHARLVDGKAQLLTRTGLDWSKQYRFTIEALGKLPVKTAYLDGELCALGPDGVPTFGRLQAAMDERRTDALMFMAFDLLFLDGKDTVLLPFTRAFLMLASILASVLGRPRIFPLARDRLMPALTRSTIIARSNSANTPHIWNMALPAGVDVSNACRCR